MATQRAIDVVFFDIGENLIEVLGALTAGMQAVLKPTPPGPELKF